MAWAVVSVPTLLSTGLQVSLVPSISEAQTLGDHSAIRRRLATSLRLTILVGLPAAVGLSVLATPITGLLFGNLEAGRALSALAGAALFLMLQQATSGVLQGLGRTGIPFISLLLGVGVKAVATWYLTGMPSLGVQGAAYATVIGLIVSSAVNLAVLHRLVGLGFDAIQSGAKPLAASVCMGLLITTCFPAVSGAFGPGAASLALVAGGVLVFGMVLLLVRGVGEDDLAYVPRIRDKLAPILAKAGLLAERSRASRPM